MLEQVESFHPSSAEAFNLRLPNIRNFKGDFICSFFLESIRPKVDDDQPPYSSISLGSVKTVLGRSCGKQFQGAGKKTYLPGRRNSSETKIFHSMRVALQFAPGSKKSVQDPGQRAFMAGRGRG